jgi:hypothetical protein
MLHSKNPNLNHSFYDPAYGFYIVNGIQFPNKIKAFQYATEHNATVEWNFNRNIFDNVDWTVEPTETLIETYVQRARQLREKYDYIVINWSGGADSTNVLQSFLKAGLRVDELLIHWPSKAANGKYTVSLDTSPENIDSEWDLSVLPKLKWLAAHHPEIKIRTHDYSDDAESFYKNEEWVYSSAGHLLNPTAGIRWFVGLPEYQGMADRGLKVGHIFGLDKPRVIYTHGEFKLFFIDMIANMPHVSYQNSINNMNRTELFYWSPESVTLLKKQAHVLMRFFKQNRSLISFLDPELLKRKAFRSTYELLIKGLLYPGWDMSTFQADKPSFLTHGEFDQWFFNKYDNTPVLGAWNDGIKHIVNTIDDKFISYDKFNRYDDLVTCLSPFYKVGTLNDISQ